MWNPNRRLKNYVNTGLYPLHLLQFKPRESDTAAMVIMSSRAHLSLQMVFYTLSYLNLLIILVELYRPEKQRGNQKARITHPSSHLEGRTDTGAKLSYSTSSASSMKPYCLDECSTRAVLHRPVDLGSNSSPTNYWICEHRKSLSPCHGFPSIKWK